ncbi:MAG: hypothetical protein IKG42_01495 [Clostridia bacterium]|nr:hypothetical protein [Clostridia bacterium]
MGRVIKINPRDGNKHYLMEKDVTYDSSETKSLINTTLSTKGWSTKHFPYILNKIGLKTPIVIEKVNASSNMYQMVGNLKCTDANGMVAELFISYHITNIFDLAVKIDNITTSYLLGNAISRDDKPEIYIVKRELDIDGKRKLIVFFESDFASWELKLELNYSLKINVDWGIENDVKAGEIEKYKKVEDYLLNLTDSSKTIQIFKDLSNILGFSEYQKNELFKVIILNERTTDEFKIVEYGLVWIKNKMTQYIVTEKSETFIIGINGSWEYFNNGVRIVNDSVKEKIQIFILGKEEEVIKMNLNKIISEVKEKVKEKYIIFKN